MKCARCQRHINTATVLLAGVPFGPVCASKMGLIQAPQQVAKTQQWAIKQRIVKNYPEAVIQDGQIDLFEGAMQ